MITIGECNMKSKLLIQLLIEYESVELSGSLIQICKEDFDFPKGKEVSKEPNNKSYLHSIN